MIGKYAPTQHPRPEYPRVVIDGRLRHADATGVASYARAVEEGLRAIGRPAGVVEDAAGGRIGDRAGPGARVARWLRAQSPVPVRLAARGDDLFGADVFRLAHVRFASTGRLLRLRAPGPPGIVHWTYPIPARIIGWTNLYTIHDVIPLQTPELTPIDPVGLRQRLDRIAQTAEGFVAVSGAARAAIIAALGLDPARIVDCGNAVTAMTPGDGTLPDGLTRDGYYLFCGLTEPRKNLPRLIAAWRESGSAAPLVIVGDLPQMLAVPPGVIVLPYRSRPALVDLMRFARAMLFPSLAEGFGLPVAEAMTLGVPVLTSDRGALAETAGDAALTVDPWDQRAIADGIARLDRDETFRAALSARGLARADTFTAARLGARLAALYDEFAGASPPRA